MLKIKRRPKDVNFIFMKKTKGEKVVHAVTFVIFFIYALSLLLPLLWLLVQSFYNPKQYFIIMNKEGTLKFPSEWFFSNYAKAFSVLNYNHTNFFGMLFNSLWFIFLAETWCLIWPVITGYVFAKYAFKGREAFHSVIIFTLTLPIMGTTGAMYKLIDVMNLFDTGPLFVMVTGVNAFTSSFLIYYGIFKGISWSYAESVFIDGGGNNVAFFYVILPQAMPAISAMMVRAMIAHWNEYYQFLMYLPSTPTVATGLYSISIQNTVQKPLYYAGLVISIIPVMILYSSMVGKMMKNLSIGGLKG